MSNYAHYDLWPARQRQIDIFALQLARYTQLPLHHLDAHFYLAQWEERPRQEFLTILQSLVAHDQWIIDGNATR